MRHKSSLNRIGGAKPHYEYMYNMFHILRPYSVQYAAIVAISVLCTGCIPVRSLNPLYSDSMEEVVFEPTLLGIWGNEKGEPQLAFKQFGKRAYNVEVIHPKGELEDLETITDKQIREGLLHPAEFEAHLVKLEGYLFLDLFMNEMDKRATTNPLVPFHIVPTHTFYRVWIEGDTLRLDPLDESFFPSDERERDGIKYKAIKTENWDIILLTSDTDSLQKFVLKYAENDNVFEGGDKYYRISAE